MCKILSLKQRIAHACLIVLICGVCPFFIVFVGVMLCIHGGVIHSAEDKDHLVLGAGLIFLTLVWVGVAAWKRLEKVLMKDAS